MNYDKEIVAMFVSHICSLQAAAEVEPATMSMVMRAVPEASSLDEAKEVVFGNWLRTVDEHHRQYSGNPILHILDIGCSIGLSTRYLADKFPLAKTTVSKIQVYKAY